MQLGRSVLKESGIKARFFVRGKLRVKLRRSGVQCQWPAVRLRRSGFSASGLLSDCGGLGFSASGLLSD
jgi:hypothetical protein